MARKLSEQLKRDYRNAVRRYNYQVEKINKMLPPNIKPRMKVSSSLRYLKSTADVRAVVRVLKKNPVDQTLERYSQALRNKGMRGFKSKLGDLSKQKKYALLRALDAIKYEEPPSPPRLDEFEDEYDYREAMDEYMSGRRAYEEKIRDIRKQYLD